MDPLVAGLQALLAAQSARCYVMNGFQVAACIGHLDFLFSQDLFGRIALQETISAYSRTSMICGRMSAFGGCRTDSQGRETRRPAGPAGHQSRVLYQSEDGQGARPPRACGNASARRRDDRIACQWSLLALSGHRLVRCTCLLMTQSGHRNLREQRRPASHEAPRWHS